MEGARDATKTLEQQVFAGGNSTASRSPVFRRTFVFFSARARDRRRAKRKAMACEAQGHFLDGGSHPPRLFPSLEIFTTGKLLGSEYQGCRFGEVSAK